MQQYFYALTGSTKIQISHTHRQFAKVCAFQGIWIHNIFKSFVLNGDDCHFFTAISHGGNIFKWHASKCHKLVVLHDVLYMQHLIPASFNLRNSFTLNGSSYLTSSWLFELWFSNEKKSASVSPQDILIAHSPLPAQVKRPEASQSLSAAKISPCWWEKLNGLNARGSLNVEIRSELPLLGEVNVGFWCNCLVLEFLCLGNLCCTRNKANSESKCADQAICSLL